MSSLPRINRRKRLDRNFTKYNYREAFPYLVADFEGRCAYSMRHVDTTGDVVMHIDHFDPRLKKNYNQPYSNLCLATAECNIAKGATWPTRSEAASGSRFINPCKEREYGVHIFEDSKTHELVGVTPAGVYQILICDLNAPHLVLERKDRTTLQNILEQPAQFKTSFSVAKDAIAQLQQQFERKIPPIPPPPVGSVPLATA